MVRVIGGDGVEYGPAAAEPLHRWASEERMNPRAQLRAEGQRAWRPLQGLPEPSIPAAVAIDLYGLVAFVATLVDGAAR